MAEIIYISRSKHREFVSKLARLRDVDFAANRMEMKSAIQSGGGMHDNAAYDYLLQKEKLLLSQISELERILSTSQIIEEGEVDTRSVHIGTKVRVLDLDSLEELEYNIVGAYETNVDRNVISYMAPLANGLMGKSVGDTVEIRTPKEIRRLKLVSIEKAPN